MPVLKNVRNIQIWSIAGSVLVSVANVQKPALKWLKHKGFETNNYLS
jgi:hypothetical protein